MKQLKQYTIFMLAISLILGCTGSKNVGKKEPKVADIDLSHWKITIPKAKQNGKIIEVSPPGIFNYANNKVLKPWMYNDSTDGSIVFYAEPMQTTTNTKYSRSELREQMEPGSNNVNWTFKQGGRLYGKLKVEDISMEKSGKFHRTIIMQIHGRLTNEQRALIGKKDNDAPPILKIYWDKGKIRVKTKVLKNLKASDKEILYKDAWDNDKGFNFDEYVGKKKFTLEVLVSEGRMEIKLNNKQSVVYDDIHMQKWGVFENYFKAGNYFQSRDKGSYAKVKYYELEVSH